MHSRSVAMIAAALIAGLSASASAAQAKDFKGVNSQGRKALLRTGSDGLVRRTDLPFKGPCGRRGFSMDLRHSLSIPPFDVSTPDRLGDDSGFALRERGVSVKYSVRTRIKRLFDPADPTAERWSGSVSVTAVVRRNGRRIDTCATRSPVRFTLSLVP